MDSHESSLPERRSQGHPRPKTPAMPSHPTHPEEESSSYETSSDEEAAPAKAGPAVAPALDAAATPGCRDMACGPDEPYREPRTPAMLDVACQTKESFFDRSVRFLSFDVKFTEASFKRRRDVKRRSFMDKHGQCDLI
eukprot:symbB.v1.2.031257.t1/scaffold3608.1/size53343/4